jgi:hypothetical protein
VWNGAPRAQLADFASELHFERVDAAAYVVTSMAMGLTQHARLGE